MAEKGSSWRTWKYGEHLKVAELINQEENSWKEPTLPNTFDEQVVSEILLSTLDRN